MQSNAVCLLSPGFFSKLPQEIYTNVLGFLDDRTVQLILKEECGRITEKILRITRYYLSSNSSISLPMFISIPSLLARRFIALSPEIGVTKLSILTTNCITLTAVIEEITKADQLVRAAFQISHEAQKHWEMREKLTPQTLSLDGEALVQDSNQGIPFEQILATKWDIAQTVEYELSGNLLLRNSADIEALAIQSKITLKDSDQIRNKLENVFQKGRLLQGFSEKINKNEEVDKSMDYLLEAASRYPDTIFWIIKIASKINKDNKRTFYLRILLSEKPLPEVRGRTLISAAMNLHKKDLKLLSRQLRKNGILNRKEIQLSKAKNVWEAFHNAYEAQAGHIVQIFFKTPEVQKKKDGLTSMMNSGRLLWPIFFNYCIENLHCREILGKVMHNAAKWRYFEDLSSFISKRKINPFIDLNYRNEESGETIFSAILRPNILTKKEAIEAILKELIQAGADVNIADYSGITPLMIAIHFYDEDLIFYLLQLGADPSAQVKRENNLGLKVGDNALTIARRRKKLKIVSLLTVTEYIL
jgi:hypothetical protein